MVRAVCGIHIMREVRVSFRAYVLVVFHGDFLAGVGAAR